jgi:phage-related protein
LANVIAKWNAIKGVIIGTLTMIRDYYGPMLTSLATAWNGFWTGSASVVTSVWDGIKGTISSGINWVITKINAMIDNVNSVISSGAGVLGIKALTIPPIPMLADGGNVVGAGSAIVGEAGPELISLPRGARVTPLSGGGGSGMGGLTINFFDTTVLNNDDIMEKIGNPLMEALKPHLAVV